MPWRDDVTVSDDYTSFATKQTTGGQVWDAARQLRCFLESHPAVLEGCRTVLELGSGTGWLGMSVARNVPTIERIYLTEMVAGGAFAWLQHNVAQNASLPLQAVQTMPCDWAWFGGNGDAEQDSMEIEGARRVVQTTAFDLVIGSDLVYEELGMLSLVRVFAAVASRGVRILYAHTRYRFEMLDRDFFEALEQAGLDVVQVDPAPAERSDSPPPMTELFPDMKCVVLELRRRACSEGPPGPGIGEQC